MQESSFKIAVPTAVSSLEISLSSRETDDSTQIGIVSYCFDCPNEADVTRRISLKFNKTKFWSDSTAVLQYTKSKETNDSACLWPIARQ